MADSTFQDMRRNQRALVHTLLHEPRAFRDLVKTGAGLPTDTYCTGEFRRWFPANEGLCEQCKRVECVGSVEVGGRVDILVGHYANKALYWTRLCNGPHARRGFAMTIIYQSRVRRVAGRVLTGAVCCHFLRVLHRSAEVYGLQNVTDLHFVTVEAVFRKQCQQLSVVGYMHRGAFDADIYVFDTPPRLRLGLRYQHQAAIARRRTSSKFRSTKQTFQMFMAGHAFADYTAVCFLLCAARLSHLHNTVCASDAWLEVFGSHGTDLAERVTRARTWGADVIANLLHGLDLDTSRYRPPLGFISGVADST